MKVQVELNGQQFFSQFSKSWERIFDNQDSHHPLISQYEKSMANLFEMFIETNDKFRDGDVQRIMRFYNEFIPILPDYLDERLLSDKDFSEKYQYLVDRFEKLKYNNVD